jgi:hypothetical protein
MDTGGGGGRPLIPFGKQVIAEQGK